MKFSPVILRSFQSWKPVTALHDTSKAPKKSTALPGKNELQNKKQHYISQFGIETSGQISDSWKYGKSESMEKSCMCVYVCLYEYKCIYTHTNTYINYHPEKLLHDFEYLWFTKGCKQNTGKSFECNTQLKK